MRALRGGLQISSILGMENTLFSYLINYFFHKKGCTAWGTAVERARCFPHGVECAFVHGVKRSSVAKVYSRPPHRIATSIMVAIVVQFNLESNRIE